MARKHHLTPQTPAERARDLYVEMQEALDHLRNIDAKFRYHADRDPYGSLVKEYAGARNAQVARVTMLASLYQVERYIADRHFEVTRSSSSGSDSVGNLDLTIEFESR